MITAILLAAGRGTRMGGNVRKQYMELGGKPVLSWSLSTLEKSAVIDDIIVVVPAGEESYVRDSIVVPCEQEIRDARSGQAFPAGADGGAAVSAAAAGKVRAFVTGGAERCNSVYNGIEAIAWPCDYVFIQDGARPFLTEEILQRLYAEVRINGTAVAGMPSKDTVKITDAEDFVVETPDRAHVWNVQTPQCFAYDLVRKAYETVLAEKEGNSAADSSAGASSLHITDDAMVVEHASHCRVKLVEADYRNIKITTPEDIAVAETFLRQKEQK